MTLEEIKKYFKSHLINDLGDTLQQLLQVFEKNTKQYNAIISLSGEYMSLLKKERQNSESPDDLHRKMNGLRNRVIETIDEMDEPEVNIYNLLFSQFDKILVICASTERKSALEDLFSAPRWAHVEISAKPILPSAASLRTYKLVVFDNNGSLASASPPLLEQLLKETNKYVLYYGSSHSTLVSEYSHRVYSANSKFSFHGRLQELLSYVRDFPEPEN